MPSLRDPPFTAGSELRKLDDAVFKFAPRDSYAGDKLQFGAVLVKIARSLIGSLECRLKTAQLPDGADCQQEGDRLPASRIIFRRDPHGLHAAVSSASERSRLGSGVTAGGAGAGARTAPHLTTRLLGLFLAARGRAA